MSLITEQLIQEKWVVNGPIGRLPRGRRPTFLRLNDRRAVAVADLRPNLTTIAIADVNGRFLAQEATPTLESPAKMAAKLSAVINRLVQSYPESDFEGIGISLSGRVDASTQRLVFAPNLKWPEFDLKAPIEDATGMQVELENAANACVLAEVWFGPGEVADNLVVVTVSEGIGTGIFVNHQLAKGLNGMAGEFGHVPLDPNGPPCSCGSRGCWEVFGSNRAALRYYHESASDSDDMGFQDLLALGEAGDPLALKALDQMAQALGRGMRMVVAGIAPQEIVMVGEFTRLWSRMGPIIEKEVAAAVLVGKPPRVRPAPDPRMSRLRGAVALTLRRYFGAFENRDEQTRTRVRMRA